MTTSETRVVETVAGLELLGQIHRALDRCWAQHGPVRGSIQVREHQVEVVFSDEGEPATIDLEAVSTPDVLAERGRGLALASAVLAGLSYQRLENVNL